MCCTKAVNLLASISLSFLLLPILPFCLFLVLLPVCFVSVMLCVFVRMCGCVAVCLFQTQLQSAHIASVECSECITHQLMRREAYKALAFGACAVLHQCHLLWKILREERCNRIFAHREGHVRKEQRCRFFRTGVLCLLLCVALFLILFILGFIILSCIASIWLYK